MGKVASDPDLPDPAVTIAAIMLSMMSFVAYCKAHGCPAGPCKLFEEAVVKNLALLAAGFDLPDGAVTAAGDRLAATVKDAIGLFNAPAAGEPS